MKRIKVIEESEEEAACLGKMWQHVFKKEEYI
jgi:hypothetical protein